MEYKKYIIVVNEEILYKVMAVVNELKGILLEIEDEVESQKTLVLDIPVLKHSEFEEFIFNEEKVDFEERRIE